MRNQLKRNRNNTMSESKKRSSTKNLLYTFTSEGTVHFAKMPPQHDAVYPTTIKTQNKERITRLPQENLATTKPGQTFHPLRNQTKLILYFEQTTSFFQTTRLVFQFCHKKSSCRKKFIHAANSD